MKSILSNTMQRYDVFYFLQYLHRNFLQIFHEIDFCQHFLSFKTYHGRQGKNYRVNAQYNKRKFGRSQRISRPNKER